MISSSILASQFPAKSGCYIIRDGSTVLYVGQSKNMRKRWIMHHKRIVIEKAYPNATVETVLLDEGLLTKEAELIRQLNPIMNEKTLDVVYTENGVDRTTYKVRTIAEEIGLSFNHFAGKCMLAGLSYDIAQNLWKGDDRIRGFNDRTKRIVSKILRRPINEVFDD
jgi:hypothetical protein